jgi:hypothetical protein
MRALPETVLEKRTLGGALVRTQKLGPSEGWDLVVAADRVVASLDAELFSLDLELDPASLVRGSRPFVRSLAVDGDHVLAAQFDGSGTVSRLSPRDLAAHGHVLIGAPVHAIVTTPGGLLASDNRGRISSVEGERVAVMAQRPHAMVAIGTLGGERVAAASLVKTVFVFGRDGSKQVWEGLPAIPFTLATHGDTIAVGVGKRVWIASDASSEPPMWLSAHGGIVSALAFDADGTLRSAGEEGWIHVWTPHARGYGPKPNASIAGRGRIHAITRSDEALFVLRREPGSRSR